MQTEAPLLFKLLSKVGRHSPPPSNLFSSSYNPEIETQNMVRLQILACFSPIIKISCAKAGNLFKRMSYFILSCAYRYTHNQITYFEL